MDNGKIRKSLTMRKLEPEDWSDRRVKPKALKVPFDGNKKIVFDLYETKIEPMLRLGHIRNIQPAGWARLPAGKYTHSSVEESRITSYTIRWLDLEPMESTSISPLVIASYDIECASSHGDFPQAKKNFKKLAEDFAMAYLKMKEDEDSNMDELRDIIQAWLELAFSDDTRLQVTEGINRLFTKHELVPTPEQFKNLADKLYEVFKSDKSTKTNVRNGGDKFFDISVRRRKTTEKITSRRNTVRGMKKRQ